MASTPPGRTCAGRSDEDAALEPGRARRPGNRSESPRKTGGRPHVLTGTEVAAERGRGRGGHLRVLAGTEVAAEGGRGRLSKHRSRGDQTSGIQRNATQPVPQGTPVHT